MQVYAKVTDAVDVGRSDEQFLDYGLYDSSKSSKASAILPHPAKISQNVDIIFRLDKIYFISSSGRASIYRIIHKMSKRTLEDAELANGNGVDSSDPQITKKSKKEKKEKKSKPVDDAPNNVEDNVEITDDAEAKAAKKERKRLKKLRKAEDAANSAETSGVSTPISTSSKLDEKAARKGEKSRLKALKKAPKLNSADETSDSASTPVPDPAPVTKVRNGTSDSAYTEDPALSALPQSEIDTFLSKHFIAVQDSSSKKLRPLTKFEYLPISEPAHRKPFEAFQAPTPIQAAAWPFLFDGRDVIGVAETGSGKTMAFAVPCVQRILKLPANQRNKGPRAVIVSPTRELAMQSYDQIMVLAKVSGLQAVSALQSCFNSA